jgi:hypothetical protein
VSLILFSASADDSEIIRPAQRRLDEADQAELVPVAKPASPSTIWLGSSGRTRLVVESAGTGVRVSQH